MVIDCTSPFDTITASGTNIVSHENHPSTSYTNNLDCQLAFELAADRKITIKFTAFDLEDHADCRYDWVRFWKESISGVEIGTKRCGTTLPMTIQADTNKVYMQFRTDHSVTPSGFRIQMIGENYSLMIDS